VNGNMAQAAHQIPQFTNHEWKVGAARANLTGYKYYVSPKGAKAWEAKHQLLIDKKLMEVEQGKTKRLMIFTAPRHYKSQTATIHFPAWYLGKHPDHRILAASYSASLVNKFSRQTRGLVNEHGPELFGVQLAQDSQAVDDWALQSTKDGVAVSGGYGCAGVRGSFTGKGANILIIDDPHKDRQEANSEVMRDSIWEWYCSAAYTRLESDGAIILIMTRWHEDDLAGRLIKAMQDGDEFAEQWDIINLPALAEEGDILRRNIGEPLWPEQFPLERYYGIRASIGSYEWTSLYQQRPQSLTGGAFPAKWLKWYTSSQIKFDEDKETWIFNGEPLTLYQGIDPAISEKESADDFVDFTIGITPSSKIVLLDPWDGHIDFIAQVQMIVKKYQEWLPSRVGIETNAYQQALKQQVIKDAVIPVKGLNHINDKYTRLMTMQPYFENGQVYMREALDHEDGFVDNTRMPGRRIHSKFKKCYNQMVVYGPKASHDDILDALQDALDLAKPKIIPNEFYQ